MRDSVEPTCHVCGYNQAEAEEYTMADRSLCCTDGQWLCSMCRTMGAR